MGTEILSIFTLIPMLFIAWDIWNLRRKDLRMHSFILISCGICFMSYFAISTHLNGFNYMQGVVVGGFFYIPFYFCCSGAYFLYQHIFKSKENKNEV